MVRTGPAGSYAKRVTRVTDGFAPVPHGLRGARPACGWPARGIAAPGLAGQMSWCVTDPVDGASGVVADQQGAIGGHQHVDWPAPCPSVAQPALREHLLADQASVVV